MTCAAPKADLIQDTSNAGLRISKKHVTEEVWKAVQTRAVATAPAWLKNRVGVSVLDVHPQRVSPDQENAFQIAVGVESGPGL